MYSDSAPFMILKICLGNCEASRSTGFIMTSLCLYLHLGMWTMQVRMQKNMPEVKFGYSVSVLNRVGHICQVCSGNNVESLLGLM